MFHIQITFENHGKTIPQEQLNSIFEKFNRLDDARLSNMTERYPHESGRDYAKRVIRDKIISLELEPGTAISDRELAAWMNLSLSLIHI